MKRSARVIEVPPAALRMKKVRKVETAEPGWLAQLACGHIVFFAVPVEAGQRMYCGVCLDEFVQAIREKQVTGLEHV